MNVNVKKLHPEAIIPIYQTEGAAGFDLHAIEEFTLEPISLETVPLEGDELKERQEQFVSLSLGMLGDEEKSLLFHTLGEEAIKEVLLERMPQEVFSKGVVKTHPKVIDTGIAFEVPQGYELEVRGRSGLGIVNDVHVFNGTVDSDYRGSVKVKLYNLGSEPMYFAKGSRIAQGVIKKVEQAVFTEVAELSDTVRGDKGTGSTGLV